MGLVDFDVSGGVPAQITFTDPDMMNAHWYVAFAMDAATPVPTPEIVQIDGAEGRSLRHSMNEAGYLIIYHPDFRDGASRLKNIRAAASAADSLVVMTVDVSDVYNEFSWGMVDPVAIRDFLAYTQTNWSLGPLFVALIGDAAYDLKGFLDGSPQNFLASYVNRYSTETTSHYEGSFNLNFYSTDDFYGYLDAGDYLEFGQPSLDVAIGRFPVSTPEDLDTMLDKLEIYVDYSMPGQWQNRVLMAADDERVLTGIDPTEHTTQVEEIARSWFPPALDRVKVYLTEYPANDFGKKPEAQADFIEEYTRGALFATYTGHGDQNTLAQEEVFVSQKMPELLNEDRYPVFSTFSCTVSRFDLLSGNSMTELMLFHKGGGAVATFASGGLVFPSESFSLNKRWLKEMFGTPYVVPTYSRSVHAVGLAGMAAKVTTANSNRHRRNNEKYVMLGDPALEVRFGRHLVEFETATVDSHTVDGTLRLISGDVRNQTGQVLNGQAGTRAFNGTAYVHVTENADTTGYEYPGGSQRLDYRLDGPTSYRGEVPVVNGHFDARFYLAETVQIGNQGRGQRVCTGVRPVAGRLRRLRQPEHRPDDLLPHLRRCGRPRDPDPFRGIRQLRGWRLPVHRQADPEHQLRGHERGQPAPVPAVRAPRGGGRRYRADRPLGRLHVRVRLLHQGKGETNLASVPRAAQGRGEGVRQRRKPRHGARELHHRPAGRRLRPRGPARDGVSEPLREQRGVHLPPHS